jgi:DNA-binding MarR family transcriptional regulator
MTQFKELDPILHSQLRLAVISLLVNSDAAEFTYIRDKTGATSGNLSVQITKLKEAGYIEVTKKFRNNYPLTMCRITPLGIKKFEEYVIILEQYIKPGQGSS